MSGRPWVTEQCVAPLDWDEDDEDEDPDYDEEEEEDDEEDEDDEEEDVEEEGAEEVDVEVEVEVRAAKAARKAWGAGILQGESGSRPPVDPDASTVCVEASFDDEEGDVDDADWTPRQQTPQQQQQTRDLRRAYAAAGAAAGVAPPYGQTIRGTGGGRNFRSNRSAADEDDQDAIFDELPEVGHARQYSLRHQTAF